MKTFELTQEQIDRLAEKKHAKELLKEFLPEAFEKITGYMAHDNGYIGYFENDILKFYFSPEKKLYYISDKRFLKEVNVKRLATEEEVSEALINEAKKRGYKEGVKCKFGIIEDIRTIETNDFVFKLEYNTLGIKLKNGNADIIFKNGKWAEIIEESEPTREEINRVLTFLKNKNEQ